MYYSMFLYILIYVCTFFINASSVLSITYLFYIYLGKNVAIVYIQFNPKYYSAHNKVENEDMLQSCFCHALAYSLAELCFIGIEFKPEIPSGEALHSGSKTFCKNKTNKQTLLWYYLSLCFFPVILRFTVFSKKLNILTWFLFCTAKTVYPTEHLQRKAEFEWIEMAFLSIYFMKSSVTLGYTCILLSQGLFSNKIFIE